MRVVVLMGGNSPEREVSLASGEGIAQALESRGHKVIRIDSAFGTKQLPGGTKLQIGSKPPKVEELPTGQDSSIVQSGKQITYSKADVVFLALHGGQGEDGTVQGMLELAGVPYTGSGVLASALAMDKAVAKTIFRQVGIPTPPWFVVEVNENVVFDEVSAGIENSFGFPAVVKPNNQGSTVGFTIVREKGNLEQALNTARQYSDEILIEKFIEGREITVAILADEALPVIEIHPKHGVYDYECKYTKGMSEYTVPADLPEWIAGEAQAIALKAFKALKCRDYGRVDMRLDPHNQIFCLEVNTLPGMTGTSLVPKAARAVGIEFPELVERIVHMALKRSRGKK